MSEVRAKVEIETEIAKCCDQESTRYSLSALQLVPATDTEIYVTATNGRILAVNRCEGMTLGEQLIPGELVAKAPKGQAKRVEANGRLEVTTGRGAKLKTVIGAAEVEGRFPMVAEVFPKIDSAEGWRTLTIRPAELIKLMGACSSFDQITLLIPPPRVPLAESKDDDVSQVDQAMPVWGDKGFGLVMPCTGDGKLVRRKDENGAEVVKSNAEIELEQFSKRAAEFTAAARAARAAKNEADKLAEQMKQRAQTIGRA
jgi:hypothetical protein